MPSSTEAYTRNNFLACNWIYDLTTDKHYGYSSVSQSLSKSAKEKLELGLNEQEEVLNLLSRATSMMMVPDSLNEPFKPCLILDDRRSAHTDDFVVNDLVFFEEILDDITDPWLKSRLADLLWLRITPRNRDHAKKAVESYIAHDIHPDTWHIDVGDCWERAARLCQQIKDTETLEAIKSKLFAALQLDYPSSEYMVLWIAELMDKLKIDSGLEKDIASRLIKRGNQLMEAACYFPAREYFQLSSKKAKQNNDEKSWLESLVNVAVCWEQEADARMHGSNMAANMFYSDAIQAYRRIPKKYRGGYNVDNKLQELQTKLSASGKASVGEMAVIKTPGVDMSDTIKKSREHVAGKKDFREVLMYFTGLFSGSKLDDLTPSAEKNMQNSIIGNLFGATHTSSDGRIVGKTPPINLDDSSNKKALNRQIQQLYMIEIQLVVSARIIPALDVLLMEHRVPRALLEELCLYSPIVPQGRECLLGYALWLGFEYEFGAAIHLLCPQLEHIVRIKLKEAGANTSHVDQQDIESENGLSTLMELPEAISVFGEDLCFELKSIFTDSFGANLRNEVAHGLLDDESSASIPTAYAWWMVLKLVVKSCIDVNKSSEG